MKKLIVFLVILVVAAVIIVILLMNKSSRESKLMQGQIEATLPVLTAAAERESLADTLSLVGTIAPFNEVTVSSETMGKVLGVYFEVGNRVGAGKTLVRVDDELKTAALESAEANFEKAKKDFERYEMLLEQKSVSEAQYESAKLQYRQTEAQLKIAEKQLHDTRIYSPLTGIVTQRLVERGTVVSPGTPVAVIVNIDRLKVKVNVPENDAFRLKTGDEVELTTEVYPGVTFSGKIYTINSKADDAHNYLVEIVMNNSRVNPLKAGMFARVNFSSLGKGEGLVIPRAALIGSIRFPQVYVVGDNNIARIRNIVVGAELGTRLEVLEGLSEGEVVVTSGQINLKDSVKVTIVKE